jgi:hypothetical protein
LDARRNAIKVKREKFAKAHQDGIPQTLNTRTLEH